MKIIHMIITVFLSNHLFCTSNSECSGPELDCLLACYVATGLHVSAGLLLGFLYIHLYVSIYFAAREIQFALQSPLVACVTQMSSQLTIVIVLFNDY